MSDKEKKSPFFKFVAICSGITVVLGTVAAIGGYFPSVAFAEDLERLRSEYEQDVNSFRAEYYQDRADRTYEQLIDIQLMQREYEQRSETVPDLLIEKESLLKRKMEDYERKVERYEERLDQ